MRNDWLSGFTKWESYKDLPEPNKPLVMLMHDIEKDRFAVCISRLDPQDGFSISSGFVDENNRFVNYADSEWFKWGWKYAADVLKTDKAQETVDQKLALYNYKVDWDLIGGVPTVNKPVYIIYREHNRFDWAVALGWVGKGYDVNDNPIWREVTRTVDSENKPAKQGAWRIWYWRYICKDLIGGQSE